MNDKPNNATPLNLVAALRAERAAMLTFTADLSDTEWNAPSAAAGWRIADVVAHIGATAHNFYSIPSRESLRATHLEELNDVAVSRRSTWSRDRVMTEYTRATSRATTLLNLINRTPIAKVRVPLVELGRYPLGLLMGGALVFDHHTHLRYDIAPAADRPTPPTDTDRMRVVVAWMLAVLDNQLTQAPLDGLDGRIGLTLVGPGGGTWIIEAGGLSASSNYHADTRITAPASTFPGWATRRTRWEEAELTITGDTTLATRLLDDINII